MTSDNANSRRKVLKGIGAVGVLGLAGCLGDGDDDEGNGSTPTPVNQASIALGDDPTFEIWDFYGGVSAYYTTILEPLAWVTPDMEVEPHLASDWEQIEDTTWQFSLREGVSFHNGEELTAEHVKWSFEGFMEEFVWAGPDFNIAEDGLEVIDDYTINIGTRSEMATFPANIAHNMVAIQHPDRGYGSEGPAIGTGPYQVEEIENGQYIEVSSFDDYWGGGANVDELTFEAIADANTRVLNLEAGDVDFIFDPPRSQVPDLEDNEDITVDRQLRPGAGYAGINLYRSPTDDVTLRRALNHAVDQTTIVDTILEGVGEPARGPFSPTIYWSAHDELEDYEPDEDQASQLVEESSYDGEELTILVAEDLTDGREIAQVLQGAFDDVGVNSEVLQLERSAFTEAERNGEGHVVVQESGSNSGDAGYIVYAGFHSEGDVNERLYGEEGTGLHNPGSEVDDLIDQAQSTGDEDEKSDLFGQVQQQIMDQAVVIPLYYDEWVAAFDPGIEGVEMGSIPQFSSWTDMEYYE